MKIIRSITEFIEEIQVKLETWDKGTKPWFRGESINSTNNSKGIVSLRPKIAAYEHYHENHILQSFRRQAGGLANVPPKEDIDYWLMLAQHYRVPTRLLDWTEGALHALYFAINRAEKDDKPRVYMLNPRKLNALAGVPTFILNYPLVDFNNPQNPLGAYFRLAWENRFLPKIARAKQLLLNLVSGIARIDSSLSREIQEYADTFPDNPTDDLAATLSEFEQFKASEVRKKLCGFVLKVYALYEKDIPDFLLKDIQTIYLRLPPFDMAVPIAFPATYQDQRMIAQRSCFTIHGDTLKPMPDILKDIGAKEEDYLVAFDIDLNERESILRQLALLGISAATIFPDLDHLAEDLTSEIYYDLKRIKLDEEC
jgi:hypothetical protein